MAQSEWLSVVDKLVLVNKGQYDFHNISALFSTLWLTSKSSIYECKLRGTPFIPLKTSQFIHTLTHCHLSSQEFGLARFKTSITKTMKGFEFVLAKMQGKLLK